MKHLKALLAAYRVTTPNTTDSLAKSIDAALGRLFESLDEDEQVLSSAADRVQKILAAVVADLRDEEAKALKAAAR